MAPKKAPTTFDLAADIKEIKSMVAPLVTDVRVLMDERKAKLVATKAVDEYKRQEAEEHRAGANARQTKARTDLYVKLAILAAAVTTLILTVAQHWPQK